MSPREILKIRLRNEYYELQKIPKNNGFYDITPAPGEEAPYVQKYHVTYHIPTFIKQGSSIQRDTKVEISIPDSFPVGAPKMTVIEGAVPFHVNWWAESGDLCNGNFWNPDRWLYEYVAFAGEVLAFRTERVNVNSPANRNAIPFYESNKHRFPTIKDAMPGPRAKRKFKILD